MSILPGDFDPKSLRLTGSRMDYERSPLRPFIEAAAETAAAALELVTVLQAEIESLKRRLRDIENAQ